MRNTIFSSLAVLLFTTSTALAQSTGGFAADPNNERNQQMAPSNLQPADPAAGDSPLARVPTAPQDEFAAWREEGGATGEGPGSGEAGFADPMFMDPDF